MDTSNEAWIKSERLRRIIGFVGGYLIDMGAITLEDLDRGLEGQLKYTAQGRDLRIGEVMIEMGIITRAQLNRALELQKREEEKQLKRARAKRQPRKKAP
ncbi:MAG: hypothetical protein HY070_01085 [Chloroflexi bacterium]|nr:hypothetical protein [Chloroflexota bacterium]